MREIEVSRVDDDQRASRFHVRLVDDDGSATEHEVTLAPADHERLTGADAAPGPFIRACFEFLLAREPKESILRSFDISQISTYFPEFEREISRPQ